MHRASCRQLSRKSRRTTFRERNVMARDPMPGVMHYLRFLATQPPVASQTDGELLASYVERRDETAFKDLLRRHGPMVLATCHRILHNVHDAEDAFQTV